MQSGRNEWRRGEKKWENIIIQMNNQFQETMANMVQSFQQQIVLQMKNIVPLIVQQTLSQAPVMISPAPVAQAVIPGTTQSTSHCDPGTMLPDSESSYLSSLQKVPEDWLRQHGSHYDSLQQMIENSGGAMKRFNSSPKKDSKPFKTPKSG